MKDNIERIINRACSIWNVKYEDVIGRSREKPLPFVRAIIAKTIRDVFGLSFQSIGSFLGRNHSSAFYYVRLYDSEYKYNQEFRNFANAMKDVALDMRTGFQEELDDELNEIIG